MRQLTQQTQTFIQSIVTRQTTNVDKNDVVSHAAWFALFSTLTTLTALTEGTDTPWT